MPRIERLEIPKIDGDRFELSETRRAGRGRVRRARRESSGTRWSEVRRRKKKLRWWHPLLQLLALPQRREKVSDNFLERYAMRGLTCREKGNYLKFPL